MAHMMKSPNGMMVNDFDTDFEKELYTLLHKYTSDPKILNLLLMVSSDISELSRDRSNVDDEFADKTPVAGSYFAMVKGNNSIPFNYEALFNIIYDNLFHNDPIQAVRVVSNSVSCFLEMFKKIAVGLLDESQAIAAKNEFTKVQAEILKLHNSMIHNTILNKFGFNDFCRSYAIHIINRRNSGEEDVPPTLTEEYLLIHNYLRSNDEKQRELSKEALLRTFEMFYNYENDRPAVEEAFNNNLPKGEFPFLIDPDDLFENMLADLTGDSTISQLNQMTKIIDSRSDDKEIAKCKYKIVQKFKKAYPKYAELSQSELEDILIKTFPYDDVNLEIMHIYSRMIDYIETMPGRTASETVIISTPGSTTMDESSMQRLLDDMQLGSSKIN